MRILVAAVAAAAGFGLMIVASRDDAGAGAASAGLAAPAPAPRPEVRAASPADGYGIHVTAPHVYKGKASPPVHHWCKPVSPEPVIVCQLFNTADSTAMLMGVEYIVARSLNSSCTSHATPHTSSPASAGTSTAARICGETTGPSPTTSRRLLRRSSRSS